MNFKTRIFSLFATLLLSCHHQKRIVEDQWMHWEERQVSKQVYDSLLRMHTEQFVRNYQVDTTSTRHKP